VVRLDKVEGKMDLRVFSAANLALALWGTAAVPGVTAITGEAHVITAGAFIPTERLINTAVAPVVKKGGTTVLTADYVVTGGGITIASTITTGGVTTGDAITIDYTPLASSTIQTLISTAPLVSIFFEGVNGVDGKYATNRIYKAKLGVAQNVGYISEDFNTLSLTFSIEKDTTVTGGGISQFLKLESAT
uniref:phage tail tube protein n=1 Tax=Dokdonella sp. TaxID=2291710 RepID=UPI002DD64253